MSNPMANTAQPKGLLITVVIALWLAVTVSALLVVGSTHQARLSFFELESLRREAQELEIQRGQYLLEQSTWAAYSRVENLAHKKLGMRLPEPEDIVMVAP